MVFVLVGVAVIRYAGVATGPGMVGGPPTLGGVDADVIVRVMEPEEFEQMRAVAVAAFVDEPEIGPLLDALRESPDWIPELSFVAECDGEIVGQVLFTRAWLDTSDGSVAVLQLAPVAVRPDLQRTGVGGAMIRNAQSAIAERGEPLVLLIGHPDYYPRFGFRQADEIGFHLLSADVAGPPFMVWPTAHWDPETETGGVRYSRAFG